MERRRYVVTYDISDDRRRDQVFRACKDYGDHAQYSVFLCDLAEKELVELKSRLIDAIHHRQDQVLIVDLGTADRSLDLSLECIGRAYCPTPRAFIV